MISAATAVIAMTISQSYIFKGLRNRVPSTFGLRRLTHCPYCISFYAAAFLLIIEGKFTLIAWLTTVCFSTFFCYFILIYFQELERDSKNQG